MYIQSKTFLKDNVTIVEPKKTLFLTLIVFLGFFMEILGQVTYKKEQEKMERVKVAYNETFVKMDQLFSSKGVQITKCDIFIRAFKQERKVEIYAKNKNDESFVKVVSYDFCMLSGELGPKRKQGDNQVPEGVYYIDRFNPWSNFYLSLGINYPNIYDNAVNTKGNPGGDIFIHGNCVSVGCIPITDEFIKELYVICLEAQNSGQSKIPVHIFPFRMNSFLNSMIFSSELKSYEKHISFWKMLVPIYEYFENNHKLPIVKISKTAYFIDN
jgi:murein L,D-transpeptidase YafK